MPDALYHNFESFEEVVELLFKNKYMKNKITNDQIKVIGTIMYTDSCDKKSIIDSMTKKQYNKVKKHLVYFIKYYYLFIENNIDKMEYIKMVNAMFCDLEDFALITVKLIKNEPYLCIDIIEPKKDISEYDIIRIGSRHFTDDLLQIVNQTRLGVCSKIENYLNKVYETTKFSVSYANPITFKQINNKNDRT